MTGTCVRFAKHCFLLALILGLCLPARPAAAGGGKTVNTADDADDGVCDETHCSLREALNFANASPGSDYISFQIPGDGVHEILLTSPLPPIASGPTIDGETQPGYAGVPLIVLRGGPGVDVGLHLDGGDITVRGLSLVGFGPVDPNQVSPFAGSGIRVTASGNNRIEHNYIGLLPSGEPVPNGIGVLLEANAASIIDNVISANFTGISISGGGQHTIQGNRIGTDPSGSTAAAPQPCGICIHGGADSVLIGGSEPGQGNLISGNGLGIYVADGADTRILGNYIGTDASGMLAIPNSIGIEISGTNTLVGLLDPAGRNLVSGNERGIGITSSAHYASVSLNWIGTDATGTGTLPNSVEGIYINSVAMEDTIIQFNLIQGNGGHGIALGGNADNVNIYSNTIRENGGDGIGPSPPRASTTITSA